MAIVSVCPVPGCEGHEPTTSELMDALHVKMGEEAIEEAQAGLKEAERREAYTKGFRTEPEDAWNESLEGVE